ncbi:MAG: hypothetical protein K2I80_03015 [Ruminococcus sp.]|nr:hypothetical protein [Ruminococcus sp.]
MFRKAQLKLFAIITSILLAIFIAVLSSINILTRTFMQRQSREVLEQIATGVEYDEETQTFTFTPPDDFERRRDEPPKKSENKTKNDVLQPTETTDESTSEQETTEEVKEVRKEAETEETRKKTEVSEEPGQQSEEVMSETETEVRTEKPSETDLPPYENTTDFPAPDFPSQPDDNNNNDDFHHRFDEWQGGDKPFDVPPHDDHRSGNNSSDNEYNNFGHWWNFNYNKDYYNEQDEDDIFPQSYNNSEYIVSPLVNDLGIIPEKQPFMDDLKKNNEPVPKTFGSIEFFVLMADKNGNYLAVLNNDDIDNETAQKYINNIINKKEDTGMLESYQFYNVPKDNGTLIAFTDKSNETKVLRQFIRTTIIIGAITLVLLSFAGYFLSKKSIEPIKSAFEKQKQFISDASHELKTPLTVISANADVLSDEIGENKWLNYIKSQTDRMNLLVNDLLNLTRLENNTSNFICTYFNLSQAVTNTALPFECRAFETNKKFIVDIEDGITINGSEQHIKQMTAIFIDNALKYSNDGGMVRVKLKKQGDKKILSVYNTGSGVKEEEKDKIFERFYRSDDSRSRQTIGGYGLGLAIAKSIIDKHRFKINVENDEGRSICFVIVM